MILADRIAQSTAPFVVRDDAGTYWPLDNTANWAAHVANCPIRYVLNDELVRLCSELAYSRGARSIQCADLLHAPAQTFWMEWRNEPWSDALQRYGFPLVAQGLQWVGRRGVLVRASPDGRRGRIRTFWDVTRDGEALASSVEAFFDFDTPEGGEPERPDSSPGEVGRVVDGQKEDEDLLGRCFRFRYEKSWARYYEQALTTPAQREAVWRHALGTIAMDVPMLLTFFLLLAARAGLPQKRLTLDRLNHARTKAGKTTLLEHVEVSAPVLPEYRAQAPGGQPTHRRRGARLHHVRGHVVRRGNQLFWRVPHLRGSARWGVVRSRTIVWTFDAGASARSAVRRQLEQGSALNERFGRDLNPRGDS